jgi:hypothetical protein
MRPLFLWTARLSRFATSGRFGMHIVQCDVPSSSTLSPDLIRNAHFHDSYRAPLARPELGIVDIFFALFGHSPLDEAVADCSQ